MEEVPNDNNTTTTTTLDSTSGGGDGGDVDVANENSSDRVVTTTTTTPKIIIHTDPTYIEKILLQYSLNKKLREMMIAEDGSTIQISTTTTGDNDGSSTTMEEYLSGTVKIIGSTMDPIKKCEYTVVSIYLQILNPEQGYIDYRNACKQYHVTDPVKALDKKFVLAHYIPDTTTTTTTTTTTPVDIGATKTTTTDTSAIKVSTTTEETSTTDHVVTTTTGEESALALEDDGTKQGNATVIEESTTIAATTGDKEDAGSAAVRSKKDRGEHHSKDKSRDHRNKDHKHGRGDHHKRKGEQQHEQQQNNNKKTKSSSSSNNIKKEYTNEQILEHLDFVVDKRKLETSTDDKNNQNDEQMGMESGGGVGGSNPINKTSSSTIQQQQQQNAEQRYRDEIKRALSADGYRLAPPGSTSGSTTPNLVPILPEHMESTIRILANEIPVGNSASILRANNPKKDLTRVLELYLETIATTNNATTSTAVNNNTSTTTTNKRNHPNRPGSKPPLPPPPPSVSGSNATSNNSSNSNTKSYLLGKKPVIVVPKAMTAPITMLNAYEFLANAKFIPREVLLKELAGKKQPPQPTAFTRQINTTTGGNPTSNNHSSSRSGDGSGNSGTSSHLSANLLEYEITDNPRKLLGPNPLEWERIVAVIVLGQSWQFKDWYKTYAAPATLFNNVYGFYIGMEGDKIPLDVTNWSVTRSYLNRDKRGLDRVSFASFWNQLDEWMRVHKAELLPSPT